MPASERRNIMFSIGNFIILTILLTSTSAYIPSVHSHDKAMVDIKIPRITTATTTRDETTRKPNTIAPSTMESASRTKSRTKWGTDYDHPEEYWFDDRIHTLGNTGFSGAVHAALAPFSTKIIDVAAYHGVDVRLKVSEIFNRTGSFLFYHAC